MTALGILLAVMYAFVTAFANVLSRRFCIVHHASAFRMLVISHSVMGVMSLVAAVLLWTPAVPPLSHWLGDVSMVTFAYMTGQAAMLTGLRKIDSSRVTPLLGLKVLFVALIMWAWKGQAFTVLQWMAVGLSIAATFMLNRAGGRLGTGIVATMIFACFMYAVCDTYIADLNQTMREAGGLRLVLFGAASAYVMCGLVSAAMLPWHGTRRTVEWKAAVEYGLLWLTAAVFLYLAFDIIGVVLTNIVMACRGLTSVLIGVLVARAGHHHLEQRATKAVWVRRGIAATILVVAVALFKL